MSSNHEAAALTVEQQHAAILTVAEELLAALRSNDAISQVAVLRSRLGVLLSANLATEEREIIGPIRRLTVGNRPRLFTELGQEAALLRSRYSEHVGKWNLRTIESAPAEYQRAAAELVKDVKAHVDRKRGVLAEWRSAAV